MSATWRLRCMSYKYVKLRDQILAEAMRSPGDRLPSEHELCVRHGVSRTTAIKALNALEADRLVRREAGRGTFLIRRRTQVAVDLLVDARMDGMAAFGRELARAFGQANPDIDVRVQGVEATNWVREIASRPGWTVACCSHTGFLSEIGLLQPLQGLPGFAEVRAAILDRHIAWRADPAAEGGRRCDALPLLLAPDLLACNRRQAERLGLDAAAGPGTWAGMAQWAALAHRIEHHGQPVMGAPLKVNPANGHFQLPLSYLATLHDGRPLLEGEGPAARFAFERGEEWFAYFRDLHRSGAMPVYSAPRHDPVLYGNALLSPWASTWIIGQQGEPGGADEVALHPIPAAAAGGPAVSQVGCTEVAIVRRHGADGRGLDACWRLARHLVADAGAQRLLDRHFTCLSVHRQVHAEQRADPRYAPFATALDRGVLRCDHPLQHQVQRILRKYFHLCVLGDLPPARAAAIAGDACRLQIEIAG